MIERGTSPPVEGASGAEPSWERILREYLNFLGGCGRARNTLELYRDQIARFYREKNPEWDDEKESFLAWNGEPQIHSNHRLDACKRFWTWAARSGYRESNPAELVSRRISNRGPIVNVSMSDIGKLAGVFRDEYRERPGRWERIRNYAYILFAVGTGVRPGEGLKLRRYDFDIEERSALIRAEYTKTRQSRVVYFPQSEELRDLLLRLMDIQTQSGIPASAPLFAGARGSELTPRAWFRIVNKRARQIGIRIRPYDLRHAFITHSLSDGANPYDLRDQVGHSNMDMMKRYYHSSPDVRRNTANLSPLRKIT